jgi:hypothetical protein
MSTLLGGGPQHASYGFGHLLPLRFFHDQLLPAFFRQAVVLEFSISIRRSFPFGDDPSALFQTMQGGIERAVLHVQEFISRPLNVLPDLVTVSRSIEKRPQDEHVQRSLEEPGPLLRLLCHRRRSTLNLATMVDTRLSIVNPALNWVVVQFEMRLVSGRGFSRAETKPTEMGFSPCARGVSKICATRVFESF